MKDELSPTFDRYAKHTHGLHSCVWESISSCLNRQLFTTSYGGTLHRSFTQLFTCFACVINSTQLTPHFCDVNSLSAYLSQRLMWHAIFSRAKRNSYFRLEQNSIQKEKLLRMTYSLQCDCDLLFSGVTMVVYRMCIKPYILNSFFLKWPHIAKITPKSYVINCT